MATILIADDDDQLRKSFKKLLQDEGYHVVTAASGEAAVELVKRQAPNLVFLDIRMPGINGLETFERVHELEPRLPVIIMTAYGTTETAIEATRRGAFEYILKPFDIEELLETTQKALHAESLMQTPVNLMEAPSGSDIEHSSRELIIGKSRPMQEVYKAIGRVADSCATVLIRGESGTGKELVARAIYQHSRRAVKPFLVINCVAIPETLLESELFGYEKGAFTGAANQKIGKIEQANGGTVFLDEIGDMPLGLQSKFLRLLQERSIERIGGRATIPVDVRIIAATNKNLEKAIKDGTFREDIYFRLNVVTITLPPLRERREDIPLLTNYYMSKYTGKLSLKNPGISDNAVMALKKHSWPGNVRELANTIQKIIIFNMGIPVTSEEVLKCLESGITPLDKHEETSFEEAVRNYVKEKMSRERSGYLFESSMDRFASILIAEILGSTGGNISKAAKILGLSRPTLHGKINRYKLSKETLVHNPKE